jgi:hypothetical protein
VKQSAEAVSSTDIPGPGRWEWHHPTGRIWDIEVERPSIDVPPLRPRHQTSVRRRDRLGGLIHEYAWAA